MTRFLEIHCKGRQLSKTQVDKLARNSQVWLGSDSHSKKWFGGGDRLF